MATCTQPLQPGTRLNRNKYSVERLIGRGGFSWVYLARDPQSAPYAIKQCDDTAPGSVMQFGQEIAVQRMLEHPSFAQVYEDFVQRLPWAADPADPEFTFVAMEYVDGKSLGERLDERMQANKGPFAESDAIGWIEQLLLALEYAHNKHIIHRDIKPANIMLLKDERTIKLLDVGIAKIGGAGSLTQKGALAFSPGFSPVEQYTQSGQTDTYSDVYAVGATLYALLTGKTPEDSVAISNNPALLQPPSTIARGISPRVEQTILRAMQTRVNDRYPTARAMLEALMGKNGAPVVVAPTGAAIPGPNLRVCPDCGFVLKPASRHCPQCGAALSSPLLSADAQASVSPQLLDFGEQRYGTGPAPLQLLFVRNSGGGMLQVQVLSQVPWAEVSPQSFALAGQQALSVSVVLQVQRLSGAGLQRGELMVKTGIGSPIVVPMSVSLRTGVTLDGKVLHTGAELVDWCDRNWAAAARLLRTGELERIVRFLSPSARRAQWDARVADLHSHASSPQPDNVALEGALRALGASAPGFTHNWSEVESELGLGLRPRWGATSGRSAATLSVRLRVDNQGPRGYLIGRVTPLVNWISVPQPEFECAPRQHCEIELVADRRGRGSMRGFAPRLLSITVE